jgi:hypothetical protein
MTAEVQRILDTHPDTRGRSVFELPEITDVFVYRRAG